ncbi:unnamed protein product [Ilex paraguariensis]|uniref:Uncharacterized protein n=1 Tax=Ilex paraguariensis TaxID=185542 RepID=A0ABC8TQB2_9AQUA
MNNNKLMLLQSNCSDKSSLGWWLFYAERYESESGVFVGKFEATVWVASAGLIVGDGDDEWKKGGDKWVGR